MNLNFNLNIDKDIGFCGCCDTEFTPSHELTKEGNTEKALNCPKCNEKIKKPTIGLRFQIIMYSALIAILPLLVGVDIVWKKLACHSLTLAIFFAIAFTIILTFIILVFALKVMPNDFKKSVYQPFE